MSRPAWSVVVPTLDAEIPLRPLLAYLKETGGAGLELVVSDGGSRDGTREAARAASAVVVRAAPGRGPQLASGGAAATGERLLFLHADSRPPADWRSLLDAALDKDPGRAYAFSLSYPGAGLAAGLVAAAANLRSRWLSEPYGDQGLALSRRAYKDAGGYQPLPLFEDVDLVSRLKVTTLPAAVATSAARLAQRGALPNAVRNFLVKTAWRLGVDPERLWSLYHGAPRRREALAVFAKPPVPGKVKTRLAETIGDEAAARAYRALALTAFAVARDFAATGGASFLYYDGEPDELTAGSGLTVRRQAAGGLGERLAAAHTELFAEGFSRVATIGSDCPAVDGERLAEAFRALRRAAAAFGPTEDGGYWLVGQSQPEAGLFAGVEWSTDRVLAQSLERASALGLSVEQVRRLRDVDTAEDLWAWLGSFGKA